MYKACDECGEVFETLVCPVCEEQAESDYESWMDDRDGFGDYLYDCKKDKLLDDKLSEYEERVNRGVYDN